MANNCIPIFQVWNLKSQMIRRHIVHFDKIPMYNGINKVMGYDEIAIYSPREVIEYEANAFAKTFDCVEMKSKGAARIYEAVKNLSPEEEKAYWQRIDEDFQRRHDEARRKPRAGVHRYV